MSRAGTALPPGWRSAVDPTHNREYYFDPSGNVQWERPGAPAAPAATPTAEQPAAAPAASEPTSAAEDDGPAASGPAAAATPSASGEASLFKKPKRNKNVRARPSAGEGEDASGSAVVRKAQRANPMVQSTGGRSRDNLGEEFAQPSDRRISNYDNKVFATNEQDTARGHDAQAQYEEAQELWKSDERDADGKPIYRGQKAYKPYTAKAESFEGAMMNGAGPARAPVHYRATSRCARASPEPAPAETAPSCQRVTPALTSARRSRLPA